MSEPLSFFSELYTPAEIDCKYTSENLTKGDSTFAILLDKPLDEYLPEIRETLSKLLVACQTNIDAVALHPFSLPVLRELIIHPQIEYIFCFGNTQEMNHLHFPLQPKTWVSVNNTKLFITSTLDEFTNSKEDKLIFWKAIQQEFNV